jgi:hypothetical protein
MALLVTVMLAVSVGCSSTDDQAATEPEEAGMNTAAEAPTGVAAEPAGLTMDQLMNMTYRMDGTDYVLVDGVFAEPAAPGSATMTMVAIHEEWTAFGDINGDGVDDAAVVLYFDPGGSGLFRYLAAVVNVMGTPVNQATTLLGDRVKVTTLGIDDQVIKMDVVTHGPDDPMCCPTEQRKWGYELQGSELVQTVDEVVGTVSSDPSDPPTVTMSINPRKAITGEKVDVYTHAFDSPGVVKLELYKDGEKTDLEWSSPEPEGVPYIHHTFTWREAENGNHEFQVKAVDQGGVEGWSDMQVVKVRDSWDEGADDESSESDG